MPFNFFSGDPQNQAMLALAAGLLESGGPSRHPIDIGQGAARGMMAGREAFMQAQQAQMKQKYFDMQMAQFEQQRAAEAQRKAAIDALSRDPKFAQLGPLLNVNTEAAIKQAYPEAKVVAPGGSLVMPNNPQNPLFTAPPNTPTSFQEWQLAKQNGYLGTYSDWVKTKTPSTTVENKIDNRVPFAERLQEQQANALVDQFKVLQNAPDQVMAIKVARNAIPKAGTFVGPFGEHKLAIASFFNNTIGTSIDPQGVASAGELRSALFRQIMDNLKKLDAQPSAQQQKAMQEALGNLNQDPNAMRRVIDLTEDIIRGRVDEHNKRVTSASKHVQFVYPITIDLPPREGGPQFNLKPETIEFMRKHGITLPGAN